MYSPSAAASALFDPTLYQHDLGSHIVPQHRYHWTYILAPRRVRRPLSHLVGWLGTAGWVTLTASAPYFASTLTLNIIPAFHPTFEQQPYHLFLMYLAFTVYGTLINIFGVRIFDAMNRLSMWSSDASAITIFVTLLACAGSQHRLQPASFVFGWHINQTGWPDGVAWILGLLQTQYALAGVDGAAHLINEIEDAHINCPKAMVYSCVLGALHAFVVLVAVAATMTDPLAVIDAGPAAILTAFIQGVGNAAGGTALCVLALSTFLFNTPALMTACSRMVQSLAVDGQLPMASYLGRTHPKLEVPVWSIVFTTAWMAALGLLIFGSDDALSAILSSSVILLQTSYIPTIALVLMQRPVLHSLSLYGKTRYNLGPWAGRIINAGALAYIAVISTFLCFPTSLPVTDAASFNYTIAVVAGVLVLTAINWYAYARTNGRVPEEVRAKLGDDFE